MAYTAADVQMVEGHIVQGERHIVRQQELIDRLRRRGLPTTDAEAFLTELQHSLKQHWEHRSTILEAMQEKG